MSQTIVVIGTFDTKNQELKYLISCIRHLHADVLTIDAGTRACQEAEADISCEEVLKRAGKTCEELKGGRRSDAMKWVIKGASEIVRELYEKGELQGIISMGGSGGTTIGTAVMKELPIGIPKIMISTLASSARMPELIGSKDITVVNSVVDLSGLNQISRKIFKEAAGMIVGAVCTAKLQFPSDEEKGDVPVIGASMYGVTTPCVEAAKAWLEHHGYEVLVFHANGAGGRSMAALAREGVFAGILDITLTEAASYVLHSEMGSAGPDRVRALLSVGIPVVLSMGGTDIVLTAPQDFIKFPDHQIYCHNDRPSHIRTTYNDNLKIGRFIGNEINSSSASCAVFFPENGVSALDAQGGETYDPKAREALYCSIAETLRPGRAKVFYINRHINETQFAVMMAERLDQMIRQQGDDGKRRKEAYGENRTQ